MNAVESLSLPVTSKVLGAKLGLSGRQIRKARQGRASVIDKLKTIESVDEGALESAAADELARRALNEARKNVRTLELKFIEAINIQNDVINRRSITDEEYADVMGKPLPILTNMSIITTLRESAKEKLNHHSMQNVDDAREAMNAAIKEARGLGYTHVRHSTLSKMLEASVMNRASVKNYKDNHKSVGGNNNSKKGNVDVHGHHDVTPQQIAASL